MTGLPEGSAARGDLRTEVTTVMRYFFRDIKYKLNKSPFREKRKPRHPPKLASVEQNLDRMGRRERGKEKLHSKLNQSYAKEMNRPAIL